MIPIMQTIMQSETETGDCLRACVASIFELHPNCVPHFCKNANPDWFKELTAYCKKIRYAPVEFFCVGIKLLPVPAGIVCIASGPTSRNSTIEHSVVARTTGNPEKLEVVFLHDPHPDGTYIESITSVCMFVDLGDLYPGTPYNFDHYKGMLVRVIGELNQ